MLFKRDFSSVGALVGYLILSFLFFGRGLVGHLSDRYIGLAPTPAPSSSSSSGGSTSSLIT